MAALDKSIDDVLRNSASAFNRAYDISGRKALTIPLITDKPDPAHLAYATENKVEYSYFQDPQTGVYQAVYEVPRDKFKEGMEQATKIGAVKPSFEASLSGSAGVVGVEGIGNIEFTFAK